MNPVVDPVAEQPHVESAYEGRTITFWEHIVISSYWFGSNFLWGAFLGPVLASQMTRLDGENAPRTLGVLYSMAVLPALFVPLIAGPLSDRCLSGWGRRRPYIFAGALVTLVGLGLMAFGYSRLSVALYFGGYLVIQTATNIALGAYSGIIPDLIPLNQRGVASGYMAVMSQLSTLCGIVASGLLLSKGLHGWLFTLLGGVYAGFVALALFGIREVPLRATLPAFHWLRYLKSLWIDPRKYPDFAWVWFTRALMMIGFYQISPFLLYFMRDVIKVKNVETDASSVLGLILVAATISGYYGGKISDRVGRKPVVINASMLIALMCLTFIACRNLTQAAVAGVLFGIGYGAYISVDWALGADVLPSRHVGSSRVDLQACKLEYSIVSPK